MVEEGEEEEEQARVATAMPAPTATTPAMRRELVEVVLAVVEKAREEKRNMFSFFCFV